MLGDLVPWYQNHYDKAINLSSNAHAICLALFAAAAFTGASVLAKTATLTYPVLQILFIRQIFILLTTLPVIAANWPAGLKTKRPALNGLRLAGAFVALSSDIWAVSVLPLATAVTLGFSKVLLAVLLAGVVLKESLDLRTALAVCGGFIGVSFIIQPGWATDTLWLYAIPIVGAVGAAVATLSVRVLSRTESTSTLLLYQAGFIGLVSAVPMFWLWVPPDFSGTVILIGIAALATLGQWTGIQALRLGEVTIVGPMEYSRAVYAIFFGWLFFQEVPEIIAVTGVALVVAMCVLVIGK